MAILRPTNKTDFIQAIKYKLGAPWQEIEIADEQFDIVIWEGLDVYTKWVYNGTRDELLTVQTEFGQYDYSLERTGVTQDIYSVYNVIDSSTFSGLFPYGPTQDDINFLFSIGRVANRENGITDASIMFQNLEAVYNQFVSKADWNFDFNTNTLHFKTNPEGKTYHMMVAVLQDYEGTSTNNKIWGNTVFLNYCTAIAKYQWGTNLGKFGGLNLPGGGTINYAEMKSEGQAEKEKLENLMKTDLADPLPGSTIIIA